jgi:hypothetical protein
MTDETQRRKLLADLETARDAYRIAAVEFDRAFVHAAEQPNWIEDLTAIESRFYDVVRRYHVALDAYLEYVRWEG